MAGSREPVRKSVGSTQGHFTDRTQSGLTLALRRPAHTLIGIFSCDAHQGGNATMAGLEIVAHSTVRSGEVVC